MEIQRWLNNYFGIDNSVSVPILISLIVFFIGGLCKFLFESFKNLFERKNNRYRFISILNKIVNNLEIKEKNTKDFYQSIIIENTEGWSYTYKPISYLETIYLLDFNEIHFSFYSKFRWQIGKTKKNEDALHNIWETLANIKFLEGQLEKNLKKLESNFKLFHNKYREGLSDYQQYHEELINDINGTNIPNEQSRLIEYLDTQEKYWNEWHNLDPNERLPSHVTYNKIVNPIFKLNQKLPEIKYAHESNIYILKCEHNYAEMLNVLNNSKELFKGYAYQYEKSKKEIIENVNTICKSKTK